jgi:hypothetical protein
VIQKVQSSKKILFLFPVGEKHTKLPHSVMPIVHSMGSNGIIVCSYYAEKQTATIDSITEHIELKYKFDRCYLTTKSDEIYLQKILLRLEERHALFASYGR